MGFVRTLILSLYAMLTLSWKLLPIVGALAGYALFAPPAWLGGIMAAVLGLAGYLAKTRLRPSSTSLTPMVQLASRGWRMLEWVNC
ncbi:hypothetical protein C8024_17305 [Sphingopyxis sp. BSNA05]|uniref:hypothetical protein n=1 Tax=Sphingopyxis sp. BSNA05 TaxID=1236614 RepID=UPI00156345C4|nr:hypothetical protein [Sphingopyxis sp. BSNA05]NRD90820.1 hypothetical protein [Sphingopyxis sp. BSNA05]